MEIKTLETPINSPKYSYGQIFYIFCMDLHSHVRDAVLMTSLHDVMSTRVNNSDLPGVDYSHQ